MTYVSEAIILAAGYGKGLEPLTYTKHKVLMPLINDTLLSYWVKALVSLGIKHIVIVANYLMDQIENYVKNFLNSCNADIEIVDEGKPLGTAHATLKGSEYIKGNEFLVIYGDVYIELSDLRSITSLSDSVLAVYEVNDDPRRYGVVVCEGGNVKRIIEKPKEVISRMVNAGVYKLTRDFLKFIEMVKPSSRGEYELTDAINRAVESGINIKVHELRYWIDIGRPWKLLELNKYLLSKLKGKVIKGKVENGVYIRGPIVIDEDSEILSGTYIIGPAYIGKGVIVGPNAYIRPYTVILSNSKVGFNVEVKESIIMENVHVSHQAYVGDSIIGEGSNLGAGTILANLRFDNKNVKMYIKGVREDSGRRKLGAIIGAYVKTGVNVSTCPGVKIGSYSWIYPGVTVCDDVPPCTVVKLNGERTPLKGCPLTIRF